MGGWADFGNGFLDGIGIGGIKNAIDGGSGGFTGNDNMIFNKAGGTIRHVFDSGTNIVDKGADTATYLAGDASHVAENMGDTAANLSNFTKSLTNIDPKMLVIGAVGLIVILKI